MIVPAIYVGNGIASATVFPTQLLVGPVQAWVLVLTLLALCCGILWLITRPVSTEGTTSPRYRSRGGAATGRRGTLLTPRVQQAGRSMSVVSRASTGSSPSFSTAAAMSRTSGIRG
jgi:membrane protein implicated in regulation of membrane protease activity